MQRVRIMAHGTFGKYAAGVKAGGDQREHRPLVSAVIVLTLVIATRVLIRGERSINRSLIVWLCVIRAVASVGVLLLDVSP